jgi:zinc transport system substrate-binding protein
LDTALSERVQRAFPAIEIVGVDAGIALRNYEELDEQHEEHGDDEEESHSHDEGVDPHYWLTVPNAATIASNIASTLSHYDPDNAVHYTSNLARYQEELSSLENELQSVAGQAPKKEFIAMHNAWSYLAAHYGFHLVATYEPIEGREPAVSDIRHLQEGINRYGITTFYAEPQKAVSAATRFLQKEFGLRISTLDPVGGHEGTNRYVDMMRFNIEAIASGGV